MVRRPHSRRRGAANRGVWTAIFIGVLTAIGVGAGGAALTGAGLVRRDMAHPDGRLLIDQVRPLSGERLTVTTTAVGADGRIAARNTNYGANLSPELRWSAAPGAHAWAVALEDPDAPTPEPFVHWLMWNIPPGVTRLAEGKAPLGAVLGRNDAGGVGYWGPRPPSGTHRYHFEVFALSSPLPLGSGADRDSLVAALRGRVIAEGETTGLASPPR